MTGPGGTGLDDATLAVLESTLRASPHDVGLRLVLVKARHARGDDDAARAHLGERTIADFPPNEHATIGAVLLDLGDAARALTFLRADSTSAETLLLRARALLATGQSDEAKKAYRAAVTANPTLEDKTLEGRLGERVFERKSEDAHRTGKEDKGPRLKVIANDDTDQADVDRLLRPSIKKVTFADVGGLDDVKKQIERKIILPYQKPSLFERFKKRVGGGILLYGPPGCGKTLLARATAGECNAEFYNVAISDVLDMYIGESERKLHALFERARQKTPAVLFFDELEALAGKRQYAREGTSAKLVSQFLAEMDGFTKNNQGVLILGATNVPWAIDPAFRRPGRFDRVVFIPPPDQPARAAILELCLKDRPLGNASARALGEKLAPKTSGFSGADLEGLVESAADLAIERSLAASREEPIDEASLLAGLKVVKPTTLEWLTTARNHARFANEGGQYDDVLEFLRAHGKD